MAITYRSETSRPLRAALLTPGLSLGGAERWLVSLVKYTDPSRIEWSGVAVSVWGGADRSLAEELSQYSELHSQEPSGKHLRHGRTFDPTHFTCIHRDWQAAVDFVTRDVDVIVAWGSVEMGLCLSGRTIPFVMVSHTTEQEQPPRPIAGITHLAAVSQAAAGYFRNRNADHLPLAVIYNGADRQRCFPRRGRAWQRQQWGLCLGEMAVGYVGRQSPEKNYMAAARAVDALPPQFKAIYHGSTVGTPGTPAEDLLRFAEQRPGRIVIRPPESHVGDILAGLDVFVLASHREACSLGLIEAWLAGVPVVATPVGSVPELQREFGPLVIEVPLDPTDRQLAAAIRRAVGPDGRQAAANARRLARQRFTCEAMASRWMTYLEQVVATVPDPQPVATNIRQSI